MKKFLLLVVLGVILSSLIACTPKKDAYFGIVYRSCNLGQCVTVEKRWETTFEFTLDAGSKYCLVGLDGEPSFFSPENYIWEHIDGSCYKINKN